MDAISNDSLAVLENYRKLSLRGGNPRRMMRFNGGWENALVDTLGVSCSLHISPWSSPTTEFSGDSMACVSVGASPLTPTEMIMKNVARNDSVASFFARTDIFPSPTTDFFETVNYLTFGSCKFRLVVAMPAGSSPEWSTWTDHWIATGRAAMFASALRLKMRLYGQQKEQWIWDDSTWEFFIIESGTAPLGSSVDPRALARALGPLTHQVKGEFCPLPSSFPTHSRRVNAKGESTSAQRYDGFSQTEVDSFWQQWDSLAKQ